MPSGFGCRAKKLSSLQSYRATTESPGCNVLDIVARSGHQIAFGCLRDAPAQPMATPGVAMGHYSTIRAAPRSGCENPLERSPAPAAGAPGSSFDLTHGSRRLPWAESGGLSGPQENCCSIWSMARRIDTNHPFPGTLKSFRKPSLRERTGAEELQQLPRHLFAATLRGVDAIA